MDLQFFVALNMMAISGLVILIALVHRVRGSWPWIAVNAAVVVAGLLALTFAWEWSGVVVAAMFIPLVMAPGILSYLAQRGSWPAAFAKLRDTRSWPPSCTRPHVPVLVRRCRRP